MIRAKRQRRKTLVWIRNPKNNLKYLLRKPHDKFSVWIVHSHCIARKITKMKLIRIYLLQSNASLIIPDLKKTQKIILKNNGSEKFSDALHKAPPNSLQICSFGCEKRKPFWKLILFTFAKSGTSNKLLTFSGLLKTVRFWKFSVRLCTLLSDTSSKYISLLFILKIFFRSDTRVARVSLSMLE